MRASGRAIRGVVQDDSLIASNELCIAESQSSQFHPLQNHWTKEQWVLFGRLKFFEALGPLLETTP